MICVVEYCAKPASVTVHVNFRLSADDKAWVFVGYSETNLERPAIVNPILRIKGVLQVNLFPHQVTARLEPGTAPDNVEQEMVRIIRQYILPWGTELNPVPQYSLLHYLHQTV